MTPAGAQPVSRSDLTPPYRIVVATDGGAASRAALRWAADHVGGRRAEILLVSVIADNAADSVEEGRRHALLGSQVVMGTIAESSAVDIDLRRGDPAGQIVAAAKSFGADLVVIGTHATRTDDRPVLRSVPGRVASRAACAVAVVPVGWMPRTGPAVVGWSVDSAAAAAAEFASDDARRIGGSIVLVHVWDVPVTGEVPVTAGGAESIPDRQEQYLDQVGSQWRSADPDLQVRTEVRHGRPVEQLLGAADHARLLVVGRHARSAVGRMLLGSVSQGVLGAPPCPVIIVPAPLPGLRVAPDAAHEEL